MEMDHVPWYRYIRFSICSNRTEWFKPEVQELMNYIGQLTSFTISIDGNNFLIISQIFIKFGCNSGSPPVNTIYFK